MKQLDKLRNCVLTANKLYVVVNYEWYISFDINHIIIWPLSTIVYKCNITLLVTIRHDEFNAKSLIVCITKNSFDPSLHAKILLPLIISNNKKPINKN